MNFYKLFFENIQQDFKAFVYWCLVFTLFRVAFIAIYSGQLNGDYSDIPMALLLGLRLSLKTAGIMMLVGVVCATLPKVLLQRWPSEKLRLGWHTLALIFFSICFMARIPYYKIFNAAFNMMLINGAHDDIYAIFMTAVKEYQLLWRCPLALVLGAVLAYGLKLWLKKLKTVEFAAVQYKKLVMALTLPVLAFLWIFIRFGGAFTYSNSVNWLSAARLKSNLLNEAILDDGQALYRVRDIKAKMARVNDVQMSAQELREQIFLSGGNKEAGTIDEAFKNTVKQPKLTKQPHNVFLIVGESFGEWPFLPKFKDIGVVLRMQNLRASANCTYISSMLPMGDSTVRAVNGLITGLPNTGIYENYQPMSFKQPYAMGVAKIMKQLGYKTVFWYGGYANWEDVKNFALVQGFDEFHCADEFGTKTDNVWGCADEVLFQNTEAYLKQEQKNEKVFHMVLTMSNHAPYIIDVDKLGFPRKAVRSKLPIDIAKDDNTLTELGHIWYADKTMGDFVAQAEKQAPDSLFIITGDHMERFTFAVEQDARVMMSVPCIFYGQGVQKDWFKENAVGCHMQLAGTLAELLAPAGFTYSAMLPSMFYSNFAFNHRLFAQNGEIKEQKNIDVQLKKEINAMRKVAAWRVLKGNEIE